MSLYEQSKTNIGDWVLVNEINIKLQRDIKELQAKIDELTKKLEIAKEALEMVRDVDKFGGINQYVDIWVMAEAALKQIGADNG